MPPPLAAAAAAKSLPFLAKAAPAIAQSAAGLFQNLFSGRRRAQNQMEGLLDKSPAYTPNRGISDYYQEALSRYNENPMQTAMYQNQMRNAQRVTAQGIGALQDRRSALSGVGRLAAIQNDASQNALAQAERMRDARFGQLGQAAQMRAGEERRAFDINQLTPYQRRLQMAQMKASAANARSDAGMQNIFGGLSNLSMLTSLDSPSSTGANSITQTGVIPTQSQPMRNLSGGVGTMVNPANMRPATNIQMRNDIGLGSAGDTTFKNYFLRKPILPKRF